jgi:hypothetical protein
MCLDDVRCTWISRLSHSAPHSSRLDIGDALPGRGRCTWIERYMVLLYLWTNLSGREHWWVREGIKLCGSLELFNSSKKMTRRGRYVQQGLVSSSNANSRSPPMSQLHTHPRLVCVGSYSPRRWWPQTASPMRPQTRNTPGPRWPVRPPAARGGRSLSAEVVRICRS